MSQNDSKQKTKKSSGGHVCQTWKAQLFCGKIPGSGAPVGFMVLQGRGVMVRELVAVYHHDYLSLVVGTSLTFVLNHPQAGRHEPCGIPRFIWGAVNDQMSAVKPCASEIKWDKKIRTWKETVFQPLFVSQTYAFKMGQEIQETRTSTAPVGPPTMRSHPPLRCWFHLTISPRIIDHRCWPCRCLSEKLATA